MSQRTLPLLLFNLGGEMLYILHQRLHSQKVATAKTAKVLQDMVEAMFGEQRLEEVFQPKPIFSRSSLLGLLQRIAHSSIMRLNDSAMDKLYDLVSMAFKYQLMACLRPEDMILITFNHLDSIRSLVSDSRHCVDIINSACRKLNEYYSSLPTSEFISLRSTMLSFLQDSQKRITVLMRQGMQHQNGMFVLRMSGPVPTGFEPPGTIRYYSAEGDIRETDHFTTVHQFKPPLKQGSWETMGDRVTSLGLNIYKKDSGSRSKQTRTSTKERAEQGTQQSSLREQPPTNISMERYREDHSLQEEEKEEEVVGVEENVELSLLHRLLAPPHNDKEPTFRLNLFSDLELEDYSSSEYSDMEEEPSSGEPKGNVLQLETDKKGSEDLNKIKQDFTTLTNSGTPAATDDDLLDLLDQAVAG